MHLPNVRTHADTHTRTHARTHTRTRKWVFTCNTHACKHSHPQFRVYLHSGSSVTHHSSECPGPSDPWGPQAPPPHGEWSWQGARPCSPAVNKYVHTLVRWRSSQITSLGPASTYNATVEQIQKQTHTHTHLRNAGTIWHVHDCSNTGPQMTWKWFVWEPTHSTPS